MNTKPKVCIVVSAPMTVKVFMLNHIALLSETCDVYIVSNFIGSSKEEFKDLRIKEAKAFNIDRKISLYNDFLTLIKLALYLRK
jgi:hypothetical protein